MTKMKNKNRVSRSQTYAYGSSSAAENAFGTQDVASTSSLEPGGGSAPVKRSVTIESSADDEEETTPGGGSAQVLKQKSLSRSLKKGLSKLGRKLTHQGHAHDNAEFGENGVAAGAQGHHHVLRRTSGVGAGSLFGAGSGKASFSSKKNRFVGFSQSAFNVNGEGDDPAVTRDGEADDDLVSNLMFFEEELDKKEIDARIVTDLLSLTDKGRRQYYALLQKLDHFVVEKIENQVHNNYKVFIKVTQLLSNVVNDVTRCEDALHALKFITSEMSANAARKGTGSIGLEMNGNGIVHRGRFGREPTEDTDAAGTGTSDRVEKGKAVDPEIALDELEDITNVFYENYYYSSSSADRNGDTEKRRYPESCKASMLGDIIEEVRAVDIHTYMNCHADP